MRWARLVWRWLRLPVLTASNIVQRQHNPAGRSRATALHSPPPAPSYLLDLPADLLHDILRRAPQATAVRATCHTLRTEWNAACIALQLRWRHAVNDTMVRSDELQSFLPQLHALESLECRDGVGTADMTPFGCCSSLRSLKLNNFRDVTSVSPLAALTLLTHLAIGDGFEHVTDVSALSACRGLIKLSLPTMSHLSGVAALSVCAHLTSLSIVGSRVRLFQVSGKPYSLRAVAALTQLRHLSLDVRNDRLDLSPVAACRQLTHLTLSPCHWLINLKPLSTFVALQSLELVAYFTGLRNLMLNTLPVAKCASLTSLNVRSHGEADCDLYFPALVACKQLTSLHVEGWPKLEDIGTVSWCAQLKTLTFPACPAISNIVPLEGCTLLTVLDISHLKLDDISALAALPHLETLALYCKHLEDLSPLSHCVQLRAANLLRAHRIADVTPLAACTNLTELKLRQCKELTDIDPLSACVRLQSLKLTYSQVEHVAALAACTELRQLALGGSRRLSDISALSACQRLWRLDLNWCDQLVDVGPLASCAALRSLILKCCSRLDDVSPLGACTRLTELNLDSCFRMTDFSALAACMSLDLRARLKLGGSDGSGDGEGGSGADDQAVGETNLVVRDAAVRSRTA